MRDQKRNVMNAIKMDRLNLLKIVQENKVKHVTEYSEAISDYLALVLSLAQSNLKIAKSADVEQFTKFKNMPPEPISYESSYTRAIRMLELSIEDVIEIEEDVFNQLVLDEWTWKRAWSASNATYKAGAF